jgi:hypothetical protein
VVYLGLSRSVDHLHTVGDTRWTGVDGLCHGDLDSPEGWWQATEASFGGAAAPAWGGGGQQVQKLVGRFKDRKHF